MNPLPRLSVRHRDVCQVMWSAGELVLLEQIPEHQPAPKVGDYIEVSPPHGEDNCPFREVDRVRFPLTWPEEQTHV